VAIHGDAEVAGLFFGELGEIDADFFEVEASYLRCPQAEMVVSVSNGINESLKKFIYAQAGLPDDRT
jgi:hypothetical protein